MSLVRFQVQPPSKILKLCFKRVSKRIASVVELVDTPDLGSGAFGVRVRVSPLAQYDKTLLTEGFFSSAKTATAYKYK